VTRGRQVYARELLCFLYGERFLCLQAAYRGNTLGLPKICPRENINVIDRSTILNYISQYHSLDRIVLAGWYCPPRQTDDSAFEFKLTIFVQVHFLMCCNGPQTVVSMMIG
jgi:hypothetical protein